MPQRYRASIGSGGDNLKCKALIEGGMHVGGVLVGLLGGFHWNLIIISWATPTPACKANFPGN